MNDIIKLTKKNDEIFSGTPTECARILMSDALQYINKVGGLYGQWVMWEVQDFCNQNGLSAYQIAKDLRVKHPEELGIYY